MRLERRCCLQRLACRRQLQPQVLLMEQLSQLRQRLSQPQHLWRGIHQTH